MVGAAKRTIPGYPIDTADPRLLLKIIVKYLSVSRLQSIAFAHTIQLGSIIWARLAAYGPP